MGNKEVENGKACALLSYLLIGIIWYFADEKMRRNSFAKYHSKQGLVLMLACFVMWIVTFVLAYLPFLGGFLLMVLYLCLLVLMILGIINAVNGQEKELPVIGGFAKILTY